MPSHWGHKRLNIVSRIEPHRHAVPAGDRRAEAGLLYEQRRPRSPDASQRFRPDEVVYLSLGEGTTSEGEFWESLNAACLGRLPVVYLVEDNGYAISVPVEVQTAGRRHLAARRVVPGSVRAQRRRHRFRRQLSRDARGRRLRARARRGPAFVHAKVIAAVLALAVGRREAVQDARGTRRRKRSAIRSVGCTRSPAQRERLATEDELDRDCRRTSIAKSTTPPSARSRRRSRPRTPRRCTSTRRTSIRRRTRSRPSRRRKASPTRWSRRSTAR